MKKLLSVILSLLLIIGITPISTLTVNAQTNSGTCGENLTWQFDEQTGTLTISGTGNMDDFQGMYYGEPSPWNLIKNDIQNIVIDDGVSSIGEYAFKKCGSLASITIPDSVTSVGEGAFEYCDNLTSVYITDIAAWCNIDFYEYEHNLAGKESNPLDHADNLYLNGELVKDLVIPNGVKSIGDFAFYGCGCLTSITIPDSVKSIGDCAFYLCTGLTSVMVPNSVTSIGDYNFVRCTGLEEITVEQGNPVYHTDGNCLIETKSKTLISGCKNSVIPNNGSVTTIEDYAFFACINLTSIIIPDSVTSIGYRAFFYCAGLKSVKIGNGVKEIGDLAFTACRALTSLTIGNGTTTIGQDAFANCESLTSVTIPKGVTIIGEGAFMDCTNITSITIPNTVTNIGIGAFWCDNLEKVYFDGTKEEWNKIDIEGNADLQDAEIIFLVNSHKHTYKTTVTKKATATKDGKKITKCTVCGNVKSTTTVRKASKVSLSTTSYTYNGKVKTPTVTVKNSAGTALKRNTDYTVKYSTGRKNVGKYKVTVTFKGNYSGTKTLYFKINPAKTTVKSLTAGKKSLKVAITKKSTQVTGYQIQYSTSKTFKSAKLKTVGSYKTTSTTLSKLLAKKTYYVRVRTYKTVNGVKYYSGWSTYKYKKTK